MFANLYNTEQMMQDVVTARRAAAVRQQEAWGVRHVAAAPERAARAGRRLLARRAR